MQLIAATVGTKITPCIRCVTELADESVTDAIETYMDWHQAVVSSQQPPQRVLNPPTSPSTFSAPTSVDNTTSRQLVVVPANSRPHEHLSSALIADWLLAARFIHGPLSSCASVLNNDNKLIIMDFSCCQCFQKNFFSSSTR